MRRGILLTFVLAFLLVCALPVSVNAGSGDNPEEYLRVFLVLGGLAFVFIVAAFFEDEMKEVVKDNTGGWFD